MGSTETRPLKVIRRTTYGAFTASGHYVRGEYRPVGDLQMCPYAGCDGDTVVDAWDWEAIREGHSDYPENPVEGTVYPND